jgi:hypothetical protein
MKTVGRLKKFLFQGRTERESRLLIFQNRPIGGIVDNTYNSMKVDVELG